jgi:hypothetical protein
MLKLCVVEEEVLTSAEKIDAALGGILPCSARFCRSGSNNCASRMHVETSRRLLAGDLDTAI